MSVASYDYAYALDPYAAYDIVVSTTKVNANLDNYTFEKWDFNAIHQKILYGEMVTGVLWWHYNYDENVQGDTCSWLMPLSDIVIDSADASIEFSSVVFINTNAGVATISLNRVVFRDYDYSTGRFCDVVATRFDDTPISEYRQWERPAHACVNVPEPIRFIAKSFQVRR